MSGKFRFLLITVATIYGYQYIENLIITDGIFLGIGLIALAYSYKLVNIYSMILIITTMRVVEIGLRYTFGSINAYTYYLTYIAIDTAVIFLLVFKILVIHIFRMRFTGNTNVKDLDITTADFILGAIYSMYLLLSLIAIGEHFIRHLDDIPIILNGVYAVVSLVTPDSFADAPELAAYLNEHEYTKFFYNKYKWLKLSLNMLEHIAILATSYQFMRKKSVLVT
jgi:hypothetical protein